MNDNYDPPKSQVAVLLNLPFISKENNRLIRHDYSNTLKVG